MAKKNKKDKSLKDILTPFNQGFNSTLVKQAGLTSKYSGGDSYAGYGEIDIDKMMAPSKAALASKMSSDEENTGGGSGGSGDTYNVNGDVIQGDQNNNSKGDGTTDGPNGPTEDPTGDPTEDPTKEPEEKEEKCDCKQLESAGQKTEGFDLEIMQNPCGFFEREGRCPTLEDARKSIESQKEFENCDKDNGDVWNQKCQCCDTKEMIENGENCCPEEKEIDTKIDTEIEKEKEKETEKETETEKEIKSTEENPKNETEIKKQEDLLKSMTGEITFDNVEGFESHLMPSGVGDALPVATNTDGSQLKTLDGKTISLSTGMGGGKVKMDRGKPKIILNKRGGVKGIKSEGTLTSTDGSTKPFRMNVDNVNRGDKDVITGVKLDISIGSNTKLYSKFLGLDQNGDISREDLLLKTKEVSKNISSAKEKIKALEKKGQVNCLKPGSKGKYGKTGSWKDCPPSIKKLTKAEATSLQLEKLGFLKMMVAFTTDLPTAQPTAQKYLSPLSQREEKPITPQDSLEIGMPYSDEYLKSRGMDPETYKKLVAEQNKQVKRKSPFERRDRSHLNVRKKWSPNQQPEQSPMMQIEEPTHTMPDGTVMPGETHEETAGAQGQVTKPQKETIWDKINMYGDGIETQVGKFVSNSDYNAQIDKPIKSIQNQEWIGRITEWLKEKKTELVEARKSKNKKGEQEINQHVQSLIGDISNYAFKFDSWKSRNGGDQTPGNKGGNMTSEGSKKDKRFEADLAFVGDTNTSMDITPEGKIGIKSYGLEDLKFVEDLDTDVFMKDFKGYQQMLEMSAKLQEDAESGRPMNKNIIGGQADLLLANLDSLLSWAHDPLYGQAWIQDYAQGNPNEEIDWAMPESEQFDKDRLEDEVHGWLTDKLKQSYTKYAPKDVKDASGIQDETMANIDQEGYSKDTPMAYKKNLTKAQQLIAKYS